MAKDFTGIICLITGKVLDNDNDPFCANHWQDLIGFDKSVQAPNREECIKLHCCQSIEQLKDWQSKAHTLADSLIHLERPLFDFQPADIPIISKPDVEPQIPTPKSKPSITQKRTRKPKGETTKPKKSE